MDKIKHYQLNNHLQIPSLGMGYNVYEFNNRTSQNCLEGATSASIKLAIRVGYRYIDTATFEIGIAIAESIAANIVKREDLFISTKLWISDCKPSLVRDAVYRSMKLLQVDYLDLYLIHWPLCYSSEERRDKDDMSFYTYPEKEEDKLGYQADTLLQVYHVMEELVQEGKIKSIGVSNYSIKKLEFLLENCKIPPVVNQVECHPYFPQNELLDYCNKKNIKLCAYFSLGSNKPVEGEKTLVEDPVVVKIANNHSKSPGQVLLRWGIQRGQLMIPKSTNEGRMKDNLNIFDFEITSEEMEEIGSLNRNLRLCAGSGYYPKDYDVKKYIWDEV